MTDLKASTRTTPATPYNLKPHIPILLFILLLTTLTILLSITNLLRVPSTKFWEELVVTICPLLVTAIAILYWLDVHKLDWWTLLVRYGWLSMPVLAGMGLLLVRIEEGEVGVLHVE